MKNCRCHCCRVFGDPDYCNEPHEDKVLRDAKHIDGSYYWGERLEEARGRWVKICKWCISGFEDETDADLDATFFSQKP